MRFVSATVLAFACALATTSTTACTEVPEDDVASEEAALVSLRDGELAPTFDTLDVQGVVAKSVFIGRRIMLTFGGVLSWMEQIECSSLNMQTETISIGDCSYTVQNQNCQSGWSESLQEYVCSCERWVVGASRDSCC